MKNIILQHWTGTLGELELASKENIKKYAEHCGADYQLVQGDQFRSGLTAPCQKLIMLDKRFDSYDTVLMVDLDMFVTKNTTENVFQIPGIGLNSHTQKELFQTILKNKRLKNLVNSKGPFWGGAFWKLTLPQRKLLRSFIVDEELKIFSKYYTDEGIVHRLASQAKLKQADIPEEWCWGNCFPGYEKAKMIHIRHKFKFEGPKVPKLEVFKQLKKEGIFE